MSRKVIFTELCLYFALFTSRVGDARVVSGQNINCWLNKGEARTLQDNNEDTSAERHSRESWEDIAGLRTFSHEEQAEVRIVGGKEAWPHSWPWQVILSFLSTPACGGAILNDQWILTASHCFKRYSKESQWTVMAGKHDLHNEAETCQQSFKVAKIISHKDYNSVSKIHDIALVKLQKPLLFNDCIRPIHLWNGDVPSLKLCTVTGWGTTNEGGPRADKLQEANITVFELDSCLQLYGAAFRSSMMCAGDLSGGVDACQGDSGGPLSCFTGKKYEIAGVVSWGVGCGRAKKPGVYTKVSLYSQWIDSNINDQTTIGEDRALEINPTGQCGQAHQKPCRLDDGAAGLQTPDAGAQSGTHVNEACPHSWPWQVSLQSEGGHYCSGTLVHQRWVLTPRHCRVRSGDTVLLGAHDINMNSQSIVVQNVISHGHDASSPSPYDLSLVHLSAPADIGASVSPVCIPDTKSTYDQGYCVTTGWGYKGETPDISPDVLYQKTVTLLSGEICFSNWSEVYSTEGLLCTDGSASPTCLGDPGGPLMCSKNEGYYLTGMMAMGNKKCSLNKPAIFIKVADFKLWIDHVINSEL